MNLLLLLAFAIPLSCLALLVSLAFLGVLTLGGIIRLAEVVRAPNTPVPSRNITMMSVRHRLEMRRGERVRRMMPLERSGAFTLACCAVLLIVGGVMALLS
jgi:hypothetical protein